MGLRCYVAYLEQETTNLLKGVKVWVSRYTKVRNPGKLLLQIHIVSLWQSWMIISTIMTNFPLRAEKNTTSEIVETGGLWVPWNGVYVPKAKAWETFDGCLKNCCCFFRYPGILKKWSTVNLQNVFPYSVDQNNVGHLLSALVRSD